MESKSEVLDSTEPGIKESTSQVISMLKDSITGPVSQSVEASSTQDMSA